MSQSTPSLAAAHLFAVDGLVAVVTGGATGIGLMIVKALEENGAKVYVVGRRKEVIEKVAKEHAKHGNIIPLQGDASSKPDLERIVEHITMEVGYVNLLVANAGIWGPDPVKISPSRPLADIQRDLWSLDPALFGKTFSNNVGAVYFSMAAFLPLLNAGNEKGNVTQSSQVIITGSIGAFGRVPLAHIAYSASKAAVTHMAKQLSTGLTRHKIRFNVIAPGLYPSEMTDDIVQASDQLSPDDYAAHVSPLGRPGSTEDMAGCILWLASKAGAWLSGMVVVSDGGKLGLIPSSY